MCCRQPIGQLMLHSIIRNNLRAVYFAKTSGPAQVLGYGLLLGDDNFLLTQIKNGNIFSRKALTEDVLSS